MKSFSNRLFWSAVIFVAAVCAAFVVWLKQDAVDSSAMSDASSPSAQASRRIAERLAQLEARERQIDETVWAKELLAQQCGRTFEALWDVLNTATNKLAVASSFAAGEIVLGAWNSQNILPHGITVRESSGRRGVLSLEEWQQLIDEFAHAGWQLGQTEFRHKRFETDDHGQPRRSVFYFSAHLTNPERAERAIIDGDLEVDWAPLSSSGPPAPVKRIDASRLRITTRPGRPVFKPIFVEQITPPQHAYFMDPLILYDLDGDGLSEIILAAKNIVYRRRGDDQYERQTLCPAAAETIFTGLIADFDADGFADFLCEQAAGLVLFSGSPQGTFESPGRRVWSPATPLKNVMVLTCGDIDQDGDLDVFLGQYKTPTLGQPLKPHYYDANDSHPSYLLLNSGDGELTNATASAGLQKHRFRRTFGASFVDFNGDGHLDLLVVSDFAGADLYLNDGRGHFAEVTNDWLPDRRAFGMGHALADFNVDGQLDFLMIGMNSPTVDRLEHLALRRPDSTEDPSMRARMTFGNRLYLRQAGAGFEQTPLSDSIARSGWSWGCSAFDFDNDSFPDVYIANGHTTKSSVRDYESEFWLHDIYVHDSSDDITETRYFMAKHDRTLGQGCSYGGYEKNRLFLNQRGRSFFEIGHLAGVALDQDSRGVVSDDLDGDGRIDLLVTTFEVWPQAKQTLRLFRNTLADAGNWIGVRFREAPGRSPAGARVTIRFNGRSAVRQIVTGDSFRSQHANTVHFGLGDADRVERIEIVWHKGRTLTLHEPAVNRYHHIAPSRVAGGF